MSSPATTAAVAAEKRKKASEASRLQAEAASNNALGGARPSMNSASRVTATPRAATAAPTITTPSSGSGAPGALGEEGEEPISRGDGARDMELADDDASLIAQQQQIAAESLMSPRASVEEIDEDEEEAEDDEQAAQLMQRLQLELDAIDRRRLDREARRAARALAARAPAASLGAAMSHQKVGGAEPPQRAGSKASIPSQGQAAQTEHDQKSTVLARKPPSARQPTLLKHAETFNNSEALREWIFEMEQLFTSTGIATLNNEARLMEARLHIDRSCNEWWSGQLEEIQRAGMSMTWEGMKQRFKAYFVPPTEQRDAQHLMLNFQSKGGEQADMYFQRAVEIQKRAGWGADRERYAIDILLDKFDKVRWPFTYRKIVDRDVANPYSSVAELRREVVLAVQTEPNFSARQASIPTPAGKGLKAITLASAGMTPGTEEFKTATMMESMVTMVMAAVRAQNDGKSPRQQSTGCVRCKTTDHVVANCPMPDTRTCFYCQKVGHTLFACPDKKAGRPKTPRKTE